MIWRMCWALALHQCGWQRCDRIRTKKTHMNSRGPNKAVHSHFSSWPFLAKEPVVALISLLPLWPSGSGRSIIPWLAGNSSEASNSSVARHPLVPLTNAPGQPWSTALASLEVGCNQQGGKSFGPNRCYTLPLISDRLLSPPLNKSTQAYLSGQSVQFVPNKTKLVPDASIVTLGNLSRVGVLWL